MSYTQKHYYFFYHIKSRRSIALTYQGDIANLGSAPNVLWQRH